MRPGARPAVVARTDPVPAAAPPSATGGHRPGAVAAPVPPDRPRRDSGPGRAAGPRVAARQDVRGPRAGLAGACLGRDGFEGPKGTYPIGPLSGKSLFQIHAEKVLALGRRCDAPLPLYVMTSAENDADTRSFFDEHEWFGLDPDQVVFFTQGTMPALDRETGRLLLAAKDCLATSPDGHGGVLHALSGGGHLAD